jgi:prepilin-type N-terminal cleavage/methylation domain-containing protein
MAGTPVAQRGVVLPLARNYTCPGRRTLDGERRKAISRAFTLIELMVVVILVGLIATLAVPSFTEARYDRRVFESAASVAQLFREARVRAMGRGGATVIRMSTGGNTGQWRFDMFEAVGPSPIAGIDRTPVSACRRGNLDLGTTSTTNLLVATVGSVDSDRDQAHIEAAALAPNGTSLVGSTAYLCFTPMGRVFYTEGSLANFDNAAPLSGAMEVVFRRRNVSGAATADKGLRRRIVVPGSGIVRVVATPRETTDPI